VSFEIKGLEEFQKQLDTFIKKVERLDGPHQIPIADLLSPSFMTGCSRFGSLDEMIQASGFKVESEDDFKAIPDAEWDAFIRENTSFSGWREMLEGGAAEWAKKQLES